MREEDESHDETQKMTYFLSLSLSLVFLSLLSPLSFFNFVSTSSSFVVVRFMYVYTI